MQALEFALQQRPPVLDMLGVISLIEPRPHLGAGTARTQIPEILIEPVPARACLTRGQDLDVVTVAQLIRQRHDPAIDARTAAAVADLRVHAEGEVEGRGALRQVNHLALRRKNEHAVGEQFAAERLPERIVAAARLEQGAQRIHALLQALVLGAALLVQPVRRHPALGMRIHGPCADLHLDRFSVRTDDRRVQ